MIQDDFRAAIDIGTTKVTALVAKRRDDQLIELAGIGVAPSSGMNRGNVADRAAVARSVRAAVDAAEKAVGAGINRAYIGITGTHIESRNRWNTVPRQAGVHSVSDADLSTAVRTASKVELTDDRRLLHVIPRTYSLDGIHGIRNPLGMHTSEFHIQTHVITGSISQITALQEAVRDARVVPANMVVQPLASADAVLAADEREEGAVLVDVGGGTSDIAVYYEGAIIHTAVIPVGGYQFTNDLSIAFGIDFEDAERLKIEQGTCAPELVARTDEVTLHPKSMDTPLTVTKREVGQVLKERVQELFRMVQLKLDEPHLVDVPLDRIVFTGGGAKLTGFMNLAKYVFQRRVRLAAPRGLEGLRDQYRDPAYASAVGIVLWGMRNLPVENHMGRLASSTASRAEPAVSGGGRRFGGLRSWLPGGGSDSAK